MKSKLLRPLRFKVLRSYFSPVFLGDEEIPGGKRGWWLVCGYGYHRDAVDEKSEI